MGEPVSPRVPAAPRPCLPRILVVCTVSPASGACGPHGAQHSAVSLCKRTLIEQAPSAHFHEPDILCAPGPAKVTGEAGLLAELLCNLGACEM